MGITLLLSACHQADDFNAQLKEFNRQIAELRQVVNTQWTSTVRAVPGERYLQIIDAVNDPCDSKPDQKAREECISKKKLAQETLKSLGHMEGIDPQGEYEASVWVVRDGPEALDVRVGFWEILAPTLTEVESGLAEKRFVPYDNFQKDEYYRVATAQEIDQTLTTELGGLYDRLIGYPGGTTNMGLGAIWAPKKDILHVACSGLIPTQIETCAAVVAKAGRTEFVSAFTRSIRAPYTTVKSDKQSLRATRKWDVVSPKQNMVVVLPAEDWQKLEGHVHIYGLIHKKDDPKANYERARRVEFDPEEFQINRAHFLEVGEKGTLSREYVWAWANMTDHSFLTQDNITAINAAQETLEKWRHAGIHETMAAPK